MDDQSIVALYWDRSEQAIAETDRKYGAYSTALLIMPWQTTKMPRKVSAIHIWPRGTGFHPIVLQFLQHSLEKSPAVSPLTAGKRKIPQSAAAGKSPLLWKNWTAALTERRILRQALMPGNYLRA